MPDDGELVDVGRYEWERIVRRCVLPQPVKAVAAYACQYADRDGTHVRPGVARLAAVTGLSERSVRGALETLRRLGLLSRTRKGSSLGRQAMTDEHRLTRPADLGAVVHMLDPEESPASAACDSRCRHPGSPALAAADRPGTPAPHDRNTGTSFQNTGTSRQEHRQELHPTTQGPTKTQPEDQRADLVRDVTTGDDTLAQLIEIDRLAERKRRA